MLGVGFEMIAIFYSLSFDEMMIFCHMISHVKCHRQEFFFYEVRGKRATASPHGRE